MFSGPVCGEKWTSCQRLGDRWWVGGSRHSEWCWKGVFSLAISGMLVVVCCWLNTSYLGWCCYFGIILKKIIIWDKRLKSGTASWDLNAFACVFSKLNARTHPDLKEQKHQPGARWTVSLVHHCSIVRSVWNLQLVWCWVVSHVFHPSKWEVIFLEQKSDFTLLEIVGWEMISGRRRLDWEVPRSSHRKNSSPRWVSA